MTKQEFDLIVVGGGPGGYVAAIRASQLGMKTALVEREHLGGICLNWGCIPTKALLRSAELVDWLKHGETFGVSVENVKVDLKTIVERSRSVSRQLNGGVGYLLKKNKVTVITGEASLAGNNEVRVTVNGDGSKHLTAAHIILATGARARQLPGLETDGERVWTYKEAMVPESLPSSLLVIGSGAIGIEFASFYNSLGTDVTVVEVLPRILPSEDEEISAQARLAYEKRGIRIITGSTVASLKRESDKVTSIIASPDGEIVLDVDRVISAVGVIPNTENLGLEVAGVSLTEQGFIKIDGYCNTSAKGIYAIGDVAGAPCLAHKASHEGVICVEAIMGKSDVEPLDRNRIPRCTYAAPQVASIGLTEAEAKSKGYSLRIGHFPYVGNGKAIALGEAEGAIKTIIDERTGELLGAHMIGADVTELINSYGIAVSLESTEKELIQTIFAHPTLSEMLHESVLDAFDAAIHI